MVGHSPPDATAPRMFYNWFDHPLIEGWREARLRAKLHRQHAAPADDGPLERLAVRAPSTSLLLPDERDGCDDSPVQPPVGLPVAEMKR